MTKRISCKVIKSFPLTKAANPSMYLGQPINKCYRRDYAVVVNPEVLREAKPISNSATYTRSLDISKAALDNRMMGQILDCYV